MENVVYYTIPLYIIQYLKRCVCKNHHDKLYSKALVKDQPDEVKNWFEETNTTPQYVWYFVKQGKQEYGIFKCMCCGKDLSLDQSLNILVANKTVWYCSRKCSAISDATQNKRKQTSVKRYGVENINQLESIKAKIQQTNLERYGCTNAAASDQIKQKIKQTNLERYGTTNINALDWKKEKTKQTNLERYGVECTSQLEEVKAKARQTCLERYGVEHFAQSDIHTEKMRTTCIKKYGVTCSLHAPDVKEKTQQTNLERYGTTNINALDWKKEKTKQTNLERYGVECSLQSSDIKEKAQRTSLEKYGVERYCLTQECKDRISKKFSERYWPILCEKLKEKKISFVGDFDAFMEGSPYKFRCEVCGHEWTQNDHDVQGTYCHACSVGPYSLKEKEVLDFVRTVYDGTIIENDRKVLEGKELDIFIPEKNIAFEFDGDYWHSTRADTPKNFHKMKTEICASKGVRLIHIFEHEWDNKKDKIKSLIKSSLGIYDERLYARDCEAREIDSSTYRLFLEKNHLNGYVNSKIRFGLFHKNNLVSVVGFGKSRFGLDEIELHRYCVKNGVLVVGGFSKLLKHSKINQFVSYVDLAHFSGKGYMAVGFKEIGRSEPGYIWVKHHKVLPRFQTQKHKLKNLLENFDAAKTEKENMEQNGWCQVFDVGNLKLLYELPRC